MLRVQKNILLIIQIYFFDLCKNIVIECHDFMQENEYKTFELVKKFLKQKGYVVSFSKRNKYPWDKYYVYAQK